MTGFDSAGGLECSGVGVEEPPVQPSAPLAHWTFDDRANPTIDESGAYSAELLGGAGFVSTNLPPIPGNVAALEVDGSSCAEAPDPGGEQDLDGFDGLTLAAWVKPDRVNVDSQMLITKYHSAQPINSISYWLLLRGDEIEVFVARQRPIDEARKTSVGLDLTPGEWVHVAGTWDGTRLRIFLDGEEVDGSVQASDGIPTEMDNSGVPVTIGCARAFANGVRSSFLDGTIDDARIYDAALSPAQIRALAEA